MSTGNLPKKVLPAAIVWLAFCLAGSIVLSGQEMEQAHPKVLDLIRKYQAEQQKVQNIQDNTRIVHFPTDRSLGSLSIQDARGVRELAYWFHRTDTGEPAQTDRVITKVAPATASRNGNAYQLSRP
jgi:hypothetical protein